MCVCVLFVSSTSDIGFNPSTHAITVKSQSAKDIDQYFKTQLRVEDSRPPKVGTKLPNGLSKLGERAHDRNLISAMGGI